MLTITSDACVYLTCTCNGSLSLIVIVDVDRRVYFHSVLCTVLILIARKFLSYDII